VVISLSDPIRAFRLSFDGLDGDVLVDLALPVVEGLMAAGKSADESEWLEHCIERSPRPGSSGDRR
jgi:hypothetical protein